MEEIIADKVSVLEKFLKNQDDKVYVEIEVQKKHKTERAFFTSRSKGRAILRHLVFHD
jgi:hypothetical protein